MIKERSRLQISIPLIPMLLLLSLSWFGCAHVRPHTSAQQSLTTTTEAQIKRIENDPNMPQQAKDTAIANLRLNLQRGAATAAR